MDPRFGSAARTASGLLVLWMLGACGSDSETNVTGQTTGGTPVTTGATTGTTGPGTTGAGGASGDTTSTTASGAGGGASTATTAGTGGGSTTGTGGGGGTGPGGRVDVPPGDPITAMPMKWTGVPVTGSICRDKNATGFGVNVAPGSTKLLIYLEGGGACFNATTCLQSQTLAGFNPTDANVSTNAGRIGMFDRNGNGAFKDWNFVYVPYCSGDVFTGTTMTGAMGQPQMGYLNYFKFLQRIIGTFKGMTQVVLSGSSAGGFGIAWNWLLTQDAFGATPVFALDDSGPPMSPDYLAPCQEQKVAQLWGWGPAIHPACTRCDPMAGKVVRPLMETALARAGATRFALTSYDEDGIIKTFFAYGNNNCANWDTGFPTYPAGKYPMGLAELRQSWASSKQAAMYVVKGGGHTFLAGDLSKIQATPTSMTMLDWIKAFVDNTPGWTNVTP